jgi:hypothetical protein
MHHENKHKELFHTKTRRHENGVLRKIIHSPSGGHRHAELGSAFICTFINTLFVLETKRGMCYPLRGFVLNE